MKQPYFKVARGAAPFLIALGVGCESTDDSVVKCGQGTVRSGDTCVAETSQPNNTNPPPTFEGVVAVAPSSPTSLFVVWRAAQSTTTTPERMRYAVFASPTGTPIDYATPIGTTERGSSSFYLNGLEAKSYDVAVRALDDQDRSDSNVAIKAGTPSADLTQPTFAGAKSAEAGGAGAVKVTWDAAQDDLSPPEALVYLIYVTDVDDLDLTVPKAISKPGVTSIEIPGLYKPAAQYRFVVRARDAAENLDANAVIVTSRPGLDVTPPRFEGCTAAVADSAGTASVSWSPAVDDVTPAENIAYDVFASPSAGVFDFAAPIMTVTNSATNARVIGLTSDTTWRFICRARDVTGNTDLNIIQRSTKTLLDSSPPTFGGLTTVDVDDLARTVLIHWDPAADDKTTPEQMIYDVFESTSAGGQNFTKPPRASSLPGETSVFVSDLTPDTTLYWVVRARDQGGNRDLNTIQANGTIKVSFARQVQPLFTKNCAVTGCHVPGNPMAGLILSTGFTYNAIVNVKAAQSANLRVAPLEPDDSYLYKKIAMNPPPIGWQMPAPATGSVLTEAEKDMVRRWISQGAVNN